MTRQETISAAQAFTEKHKDSHKIHLEDGYILDSTDNFKKLGVPFIMPKTWVHKDEWWIWAIDQNGVFTTEF